MRCYSYLGDCLHVDVTIGAGSGQGPDLPGCCACLATLVSSPWVRISLWDVNFFSGFLTLVAFFVCDHEQADTCAIDLTRPENEGRESRHNQRWVHWQPPVCPHHKRWWDETCLSCTFHQSWLNGETTSSNDEIVCAQVSKLAVFSFPDRFSLQTYFICLLSLFHSLCITSS